MADEKGIAQSEASPVASTVEDMEVKDAPEHNSDRDSLNNGSQEEGNGGVDESEAKRPRLESNGDNVGEEPVKEAEDIPVTTTERLVPDKLITPWERTAREMIKDATNQPVKEAEDIAVPELCQGKRKESVVTVETIPELRRSKRIREREEPVGTVETTPELRQRKRKRKEESNVIPKDWPAFKKCPQYERLMYAALYTYPWEEDDYVFDFDAFYPPLPDGPPWLRKLVEETKHMVWPHRPDLIGEEEEKLCPVCCPHVGFMDCSVEDSYYPFYPDIGHHPVWKMNPNPIPFHILYHFFTPSGGPNRCPRLVTPDQLESTKKFLKQLRASRGYDVDGMPHPGLVTTCCYFSTPDLDISFDGINTVREFVEKGLHGVIDYISFKTSKSYQVEVLKFVSTDYMELVTFKAAGSPTAAPETFIASVESLRPSFLNSFSNIIECLLRPSYDAPCVTKPLPRRWH